MNPFPAFLLSIGKISMTLPTLSSLTFLLLERRATKAKAIARVEAEGEGEERGDSLQEFLRSYPEERLQHR
jgi:hypothetical protein